MEKHKVNWGDWVTPSLILVTPFLNFLDYHAYGLARPESLLIIAILAGLGLCVSLTISLWSRVPFPVLRRWVPLRAGLLALVVVFFVDSQPDLRKPGINLLSDIFSDGGRCVPCIGSFFVIVFLLVFAAALPLGKNAGKVFAAVFAVMLVSTLLLPRAADDRRVIIRSETAIPATENTRSDLPVVVHIILDEQIGIEGIPGDLPGGMDLRAELRDFYVENGFRVFGRAFSQYVNTGDSLSNLVNAAAQSRGERFVTPFRSTAGAGYIMSENAWFERLDAMGYRFHVYQSDYLDFCAKTYRISSCTNYPANGVAVLRDMEAPTTTRVALVFGYFLQPLSFFSFVNGLPSSLRNHGKEPQTVEVAPDRWNPAALSAPWAKLAAERLIDDLRMAEPGTVYFAHLLLPHRGFVLDENCGLKQDPGSWYDHPHLGLVSGQRLSGQSRRERYIEYFKQVRCTRNLMGGVMEALEKSGSLDSATIVIHGDHGSRIAGLPPLEKHASRLTDTDMVDNFSVLFAIRSAGLEPAYESRVRSVQALFAEFAFGRPFGGERSVVFLRPTAGGPSADLIELPFPGFE